MIRGLASVVVWALIYAAPEIIAFFAIIGVGAVLGRLL